MALSKRAFLTTTPAGYVTVPVEAREIGRAVVREMWKGMGGAVREGVVETFDKALDAMLAASPTAPGDAGGAWRPIASAPKDGTRINLFGVTWSWDKQGNRHTPNVVCEGYLLANIWQVNGGTIQPTHWQPLPPPPPVSDGE